MNFSLVAVLGLAGSSMGLMAAMVLLRLPFGHRVANRVLALLMLVLTLSLLQRFMSGIGLVSQYPHLQGVTGPINYLIGPLLYFYLRLMSEPNYRLSRLAAWHALPVPLSFLLYLPVYLSSVESKRDFIDGYQEGEGSHWMTEGLADISQLDLIPAINMVQMLLFLTLLGAYSLISLHLLKGHRETLHQGFSATERMTLSWLRNLALLALVITVSSFASIALIPMGFSVAANQLTPVLFMLILCGYGGYNGICQPLIYQSREASPETQTKAKQVVERGKYQKSGLDEQGQKLCWEELEDYMAEYKPYLTRGLTIAQLAELLNLPVAYLSQTINAESGMSFFDYINRARFEATKQRLKQAAGGQPVAISELYLEVGFNSKSSFYTQFKKYSGGLTPREYMLQESSLTG